MIVLVETDTETEISSESELIETIGIIHEVSILLNSNIMDALECAEESKAALNQLTYQLQNDHNQIEQKWTKTGEELRRQLQTVESGIQSALTKSAEYTLEHATGHYNSLADSVKLLQEHQTQIQEKLLWLNGKLKNVFEANAVAQAQHHNEMFAQITAIIEAHSEIATRNHKNLSGDLELSTKAIKATGKQLREQLRDHEATMAARFEEQTKQMDKSYRKWSIWLLVLIILGYFI